MQRRSRFLLITMILVVAVAVMSLSFQHGNSSKWHRSMANTCPHDKDLNTYDQWRKGVAFPHIAPEAKLQRVRENYSEVSVGSSKGDVLKAFGPPDFEEEMYPKEGNRPCVGYAFTYYFEKLGDVDNELKDKRIEVFFNRDGKLNWVVGDVGLPEKGGFAHRP